ncbi:ImmA/IrrE family metallo-endopeptidase [uncultured Sphingomonas sp.]|uniref:ImmA/IrrE family metallo-endopeptidase n=1 Tax=uncultured Sphingomonas sp. TaxID=158754 RepID=UPI0025D99A88|nr:ImmA/IrrE family metallo-endopeptidase [uncultured Sphingomonas sp.]
MKPEFASFGDPSRFEIAMRWRSDAEPRQRRPAEYGWSMGDLRLTIGNTVLSGNATGESPREFVSWYLLPIAQWFADNWIDLLHQADFPWHEFSAAPAVAVVGRKLRSLIDARDAAGREEYRKAQAWRDAHALNSASNGGLLPDLYIRRYLDTIELSWTAATPLFAPNQFRFTSGRGLAYLAVKDVAVPLWNALQWVAHSGENYDLEETERAALNRLTNKLKDLSHVSVVDLTAHRIGDCVYNTAIKSLHQLGLDNIFANDNDKIDNVPAVERFSAAVAMYGGLSPSLTAGDVSTLTQIIASASQGQVTAPKLDSLSAADGGPPLGVPYSEGYEWASDLLEEDCTAEFIREFVDIEGFLSSIGVRILDDALETESIRGVALAGDGLAPTIFVNANSPFNFTSEGRRFTLAHELAHLLHDRTMAKSVGISSGPWAPAGVEKRANAFAAMFLMPRDLVLNAFRQGVPFNKFEEISSAARILRVRPTALIEHLFNINLIDEFDREQLRTYQSNRESAI